MKSGDSAMGVRESSIAAWREKRHRSALRDRALLEPAEAVDPA
jgi:hypothetical protein